jgi:serine/threonine protein kinase
MTQVSPFELFNDTEDTWIWRQYLNNNSVSDRLGSILDKMLERATNRRYSSADDILEALSSEGDPPDTAPPDTESPKKSGLYWTLESLEVYQLQAIYKRISLMPPPTESKQLTEKIYEFLEGFTKQHQKQTNANEEDLLSLWTTHLLELVNSLSMPQEKMEATKNLILVEISKIKLIKKPQERDEKLEAIAKQLLLFFFEESNAEGVFKDVIRKNSEPYQSLLTEKPLKQAASSNFLIASGSVFSLGVVSAISIYSSLKTTKNTSSQNTIPNDADKSWLITAAERTDEGWHNFGCFLQDHNPFNPHPFTPPCGVASNDISGVSQTGVENTDPWPLVILIIFIAGIVAGTWCGIRYNNRRKKLLFIQTIFSIYSYKFQNGLEKL